MAVEKFDIAIVGAGIAGSTLAAVLADQNVNVVLFEKDSFSGESNACGGLFDKKYYDKVLPSDEIIEQRICKNIFVLPWGEISLPCDQVTVKRRVFDRKLAQLAEEKGAVLRNNSKVIDFNVLSPGNVSLEVRDDIKKIQYKVESKLIIFADGPQSLAAKNALFLSDQNRPYWAYAYAYEVQTVPIDHDSIKIYLDQDLFTWGYGWIFPNISESNIGVGTLLKFRNKQKYIKDKLFYFINNYGPTAKLLSGQTIIDKKGGYIPMKLLDNFVDDSQVVIGDAAGLVSPLFGAGIDYSIEAAHQCAPVLIESLRENDFSRSKLTKYEKNIDQALIREIKKQFFIARIIIFWSWLGKSLPIKIFTVIALGSMYTRWNKIKILFFPLIGKPSAKSY